MKINLKAYLKTVGIWLLQIQLFKLLKADVQYDNDTDTYHPIPGSSCVDDVQPDINRLGYEGGYPFNVDCNDNFYICPSGSQKWAYIDTHDLKDYKTDENVASQLYDSIDYQGSQ
ncbi:MAG: hypothetical protein MHPSP_000425 [Paramarteilia canceri]